MLRETVQVSVCVDTESTTLLLSQMNSIIPETFVILAISAPSSSVKEQVSSDPHDSDAEKSEGIFQAYSTQDNLRQKLNKIICYLFIF